MVLNYIWVAFFVIAFLIALIKLVFLDDGRHICLGQDGF